MSTHVTKYRRASLRRAKASVRWIRRERERAGRSASQKVLTHKI